MDKTKTGLLTVERAKMLADLLTINFCEDFCEDIEYETDELRDKIQAYVKAKKELEELLEISR